jgi:hypothetical protein
MNVVIYNRSSYMMRSVFDSYYYLMKETIPDSLYKKQYDMHFIMFKCESCKELYIKISFTI